MVLKKPSDPAFGQMSEHSQAGQACVGGSGSSLVPLRKSSHHPSAGGRAEIPVSPANHMSHGLPLGLSPTTWQRWCLLWARSQERAGHLPVERFLGRSSAKGSIAEFPDPVTEDQGSWVAVETEIEGVLWGFTCRFWKPCFSLRWLTVTVKALRKLPHITL